MLQPMTLRETLQVLLNAAENFEAKVAHQWRLFWLRRSLKRFPRLYELYMRSQHNSPQNYFEERNFVHALDKHDTDFRQIEHNLQQMEDGAWHAFKRKTVRLVTVADHWGWHSGLFDRLEEASAYCY